MIKFNLNASQLQIFDTAIKLFKPNGPRQSGRTYALACSFIYIALNDCNTWIPVVDHDQHGHAKSHMLSMIKNIIEKDEKLSEMFSIEFRNKRIRCNNHGNVEVRL